MLKIRVVNRKEEIVGVWIMRGNSVLGNKFYIGRDGTREEVIEKFEIWLKEKMKKNNEVSKEMKRLLDIARKSELVLVCCCKPLACHGDVIKKYIEKLDKLRGES